DDLPRMEHFKGIQPRPPAVCLTVEDSGCGIKQRHLGAIFDPFFTTKATHKGSGLGLYNAGLFVEKHHGCISVLSQEGVGSTFQIWLPQADFSEKERTGGVAGALPSGRRTVLLSGQAGEIFERTAEMLRSHGYYVVPAGSPEGASDALSSGDYQVDAAILL